MKKNHSCHVFFHVVFGVLLVYYHDLCLQPLVFSNTHNHRIPFPTILRRNFVLADWWKLEKREKNMEKLDNVTLLFFDYSCIFLSINNHSYPLVSFCIQNLNLRAVEHTKVIELKNNFEILEV